MPRIIVLILLGLSLSVNAFAFRDSRARLELNRTKVALAMEKNIQGKLAILDRFKSFMDNHLQTMPLDQSASGLEEFGDLNEFFMALMTVRVDGRALATSCQKSAKQIRSEGLLPEEGNKLAPSALMALEILQLVCK